MLDEAGRTPSLLWSAARAARPSADGIGDRRDLGVVKTNIGIKDAGSPGSAARGSPDITDGVELQIGSNTWPRRSRPPASVSMELTSDGCSGRSFEIELEQLPQPF